MSQTTENIETRTKHSPIFALHGTASSGQQWYRLRDKLTDSRLVITPDLPGYNNSRRTIEVGLEARLKPILQQFLNIGQPAHIIGHSFGGALALRLAEMYPEKCLSVSIYEPTSLNVFRSVTAIDDQQTLTEFEKLSERISQSPGSEAMSSFIDFWMGEGQWLKMSKDSRAKLIGFSDIVSQDFEDGLHDARVPASYPRYKGPTHLLVGENTVKVAKTICSLLSKNLESANLSQLPDMGHMGPMSHPNIVNEVIIRFIEDVEL
jgi:pimeloyl-ACP methyl ester carboxylesterase